MLIAYPWDVLKEIIAQQLDVSPEKLAPGASFAFPGHAAPSGVVNDEW